MNFDCLEEKTDQPLLEVNKEFLINLPRDQRIMLNDWFESVWKIRESEPERHYYAFLHAWEILSIMAEILTGSHDSDRWYTTLLEDGYLKGIFNGVMENKKSLMRMYVKRFAQLFPIFEITELDKQGIEKPQSIVRAEVIKYYEDKGLHNYAPGCWKVHSSDSEFLPDWEHTLSAWYMVRKNLLKSPHGWSHTELSVRIVSSAFLALIYFFKEGKLFFENPSLRPDIFERTQVLSSL